MGTDKIICYTDGSCKGNPGIGGWGWISYYTIIENKAKTIKVNSNWGGKNKTTNNNMELTAILEVFTYLSTLSLKKDTVIKLISDSEYAIKPMIGEIVVLEGKLISEYKVVQLPPLGNFSNWLSSENQHIKEYDPKLYWKDKKDKPNGEEWFKIYNLISDLIQKGIIIKMGWVKGHAKIKGNEEADELSNCYYKSKNKK